MQRIVLVLPARLGDALFCTPALALLKKHNQKAQLDVIAMSPVTAHLLAYNPDINQVFIGSDNVALQQLSNKYDIAINLHYEAISDEVLSSLAPRYLSIEPPDVNKHQSEQALTFIQQYLQCEVTEAQRQYLLYPQWEHHEKVQQQLKEQGVDLERDILIGCHIGCHRIAGLSWWKLLRGTNHKKVWPLKNFVELEKALTAKNQRIRFVLTGSNSEQYLGKKFLKKAPNAINLIDKTSVLELVALMDYLTTYVVSDTGTLHVACATKVNLIALFGPTSLIRTGPYPQQGNHRIIQQAKITDISIQEVVKAVLHQLA